MKKISLLFFAFCLLGTFSGLHGEGLKVWNGDIESYLKSKGIKGVDKTAEGLYYKVTTKGKGQNAKPGDYVKIHYAGKLLDGKQFDSSRDKMEPFVFRLGERRVIQGWEIGVTQFNKGAKGTLFIPPSLAYGSRGAGGVIPPNASLIFDIEVLDVMDEAAYELYLASYELEKKREYEQKAAKRKLVEDQKILAYARDVKKTTVKTNSGLRHTIEMPGKGPKVKNGQRVILHYVMKKLDGNTFYTTFDKGEPFRFTVGAAKRETIKGLEEGVKLLSKGGKAIFYVPSELAYGDLSFKTNQGMIEENSVLIFEVEVVDVQDMF